MDRSTAPIGGNTLTIYASLPRHGVSAREAEAVAAGEWLALADARGHAGGRRVRLVELDSSDPNGETWDPSAVELNAKRAANDPTAIAYLGELDLGASAVSVPVTNEAGILQVSPGDGLTSLTRPVPAGLGSSPARYYPDRRRTFLRLVPADLIQAAVLVGWVQQGGAHALEIVQDGRLFGRELAVQVIAAAENLHLPVTEVVEAKDDPASYPGLAAAVARRGPDAVLYTGLGGAGAGSLLAAIGAALPRAHLFASSSLATASPSPPELPDIDFVKPALPARSYGAAARRLLARLTAQLGTSIDPEALYGYEAMRVVLDAINRAGRRSNRRDAVVSRALEPRARRSPIGGYSVIPGGDVSTTRLGEYRHSGGRTAFVGAASASESR
ncbi:MAG: branched-chain amino acid ABC transporter substrate-binding protein [Thermoleophilaceae bacterium]